MQLYILQLNLEDANNPLALLAEKQQQEQQELQENEGEPKVVKKSVPELISMILSSLLQLLREDKLAGMLSIRKGKVSIYCFFKNILICKIQENKSGIYHNFQTLLLRFLPFLNVTEYKSQVAEIWTGLLRGLVIIGRRDSNLLVNFYSEFRRWIQTVTSFSILSQLVKAFMESSNQPTKTNSLAFALTNKVSNILF